MATYYVRTDGHDTASGLNNTNNATTGAWLTPQRATKSPVAPGDLILVNDGTYTEPGSNGGIVCYISVASRSSVAGTLANRITMRSLNQYGAIITVPGSQAGSNYGILASANYWKIEGFEITGGAGQSGTSVAYHGIGLAFPSPTGVEVRNNKIHHIGRTVCSNSPFGFSGLLIGQPGSPVIDAIVEDNLIYSIGRLLNGESGCGTTITQHDHALYIDCSTNLIARRNQMYDIRSGWPIHIFPGDNINFAINNNTMDGTTDGTAGHIILCGNASGSIKNNISYQSKIAMVHYASVGTMNVLIDHNIYFNQQSNGTPPAGVTFTNNLQSTTPGFTNAGTHDYTLAPGAFAIDKGADVGQLFNGAAPDCGYYESGDITPPAVPTGVKVL
jgi:hypothetical protein